MSRHRVTLVALSALAIAACSASPPASPAASTPPSGSPQTSQPPASGSGGQANGGIEHPAGATDVILRFEEGGGFVMPAFLAASTPIFTLYGDGTIVFRNALEAPPPADDGVIRGTPLRTAKLSEEQVQALLEFALNESGLGVARARYDNNMVADAGTAIFDVRVTGMEKKVEVYALGIDDPTGPDAPARVAFGRLAERLKDFDQGGSIATDEWVPTRYRGVLMDGAGMTDPARPWPWKDVKDTDFAKPGDDATLNFPMRELSADDVAALGIDGISGGAQNIPVKAPDGKTVYSLVVRPLLPDEKV